MDVDIPKIRNRMSVLKNYFAILKAYKKMDKDSEKAQELKIIIDREEEQCSISIIEICEEIKEKE